MVKKYSGVKKSRGVILNGREEVLSTDPAEERAGEAACANALRQSEPEVLQEQ